MVERESWGELETSSLQRAKEPRGNIYYLTFHWNPYNLGHGIHWKRKLNTFMIVAKHHVWDKMADVDQPLVSTAKLQVTIVCPRSAHPPRNT